MKNQMIFKRLATNYKNSISFGLERTSRTNIYASFTTK